MAEMSVVVTHGASKADTITIADELSAKLGKIAQDEMVIDASTGSPVPRYKNRIDVLTSVVRQFLKHVDTERYPDPDTARIIELKAEIAAREAEIAAIKLARVVVT